MGRRDHANAPRFEDSHNLGRQQSWLGNVLNRIQQEHDAKRAVGEWQVVPISNDLPHGRTHVRRKASKSRFGTRLIPVTSKRRSFDSATETPPFPAPISRTRQPPSKGGNSTRPRYRSMPAPSSKRLSAKPSCAANVGSPGDIHSAKLYECGPRRRISTVATAARLAGPRDLSTARTCQRPGRPATCARIVTDEPRGCR